MIKVATTCETNFMHFTYTTILYSKLATKNVSSAKENENLNERERNQPLRVFPGKP